MRAEAIDLLRCNLFSPTLRLPVAAYGVESATFACFGGIANDAEEGGVTVDRTAPVAFDLRKIFTSVTPKCACLRAVLLLVVFFPFGAFRAKEAEPVELIELVAEVKD